MIIFLYSMVIKNGNGTDFPYVSAFFKRPRNLELTPLETEETLIPLNKVWHLKKKGKGQNDVIFKSSDELLLYVKHYGDNVDTVIDPVQNRYSSKKRTGLQTL